MGLGLTDKLLDASPEKHGSVAVHAVHALHVCSLQDGCEVFDLTSV